MGSFKPREPLSLTRLVYLTTRDEFSCSYSEPTVPIRQFACVDRHIQRAHGEIRAGEFGRELLAKSEI